MKTISTIQELTELVRSTEHTIRENESSENYIHTHYRVRYTPELNLITSEEVCINDDNYCYGINTHTLIDAEVEEDVFDSSLL